MRRGERDAMVQLMDSAERQARSLPATTPAQQLLRLENLHPVMESRSKEARWLGDRDLALARAQEVIDLDRYDPKSWLELGELLMMGQRWAEAAEAFSTAAMLGPPVSAIARHLLGCCLRLTGQEMLASFFFQSALEIDGYGISPRAEIQAQPQRPVLDSLKEWSSRRFESPA
jgi:tetratricopeptide (TPR) repeat protein